MSNRVRIKLVAAFISLSLCATWFLFTQRVAGGNANNTITPYVFVADSHVMGHYDKLMPLWRARIGGNWIAGRLSDAVSQKGILTVTAYNNVSSLYHATWLFMTFALIIWLAENPVFVIPFIFAGMCYSLTPTNDVTIYPWDMPSMFFWTLSFLLWERKQYYWMLAAIIIGTLFKETVAVTAFFFFFATLERRKRLALFVAAAFGCLLMRLWITHAVVGHSQVSTLYVGKHPGFAVLKDLLTPHVNHFIWVNAGTFIVALCLPMKTLADKGTKFVLVVFLACQTIAEFLGATPYEFRQFLDVLPISVFYLDRTIQRWKAEEKEVRLEP